MHKVGQPGGFLGKFLEPLLKTGLPLMKNAFKPLAKSILIPIGLTAAAAVTNVAIHKNMIRSDKTTLIIFNEEMNIIMKIVTSPEVSDLLIKWVSKAIKNEAKEQICGFLGILFDALGASLY